jgi:alcohol dehydrogenase class IV
MTALSFKFHLPTHIIFGSGILDCLFQLQEVTAKNCLILSYAGFDRQDVFDRLKQISGELTIWSEFQENPSESYVTRLAGVIKEKHINTVIAIGGGSSIDSAKAASWFAGQASCQENATAIDPIKIIAIPTTAGTGSEVTPYAILTDDKTQRKRILNYTSLFPDIALCDPQLTCSMPVSVTANTGIDALSHAIEAYLSTGCSGFMEDIAVNGCRLVAEFLPQVLEQPHNEAGRSKMMQASLMGGMVLAQCGTVMVHALGYCLTHEFGYPHGYANALLLAGFVERLADRGSERAKKIMQLFHDDLAGFIERSGIKVPSELKKAAHSLDQWIEAGYQSYGRVNSVVPLDHDDIRFILEKVIDSNNSC